MPQVVETPFESQERLQAVDLRRRVLRLPLGQDFAASELEGEQEDLCLVAMEHGRVIGCCLLSKPREVMLGAVRLRQVAVDPAFQGKGVGKALVAEAEAVAAKLGYCRMLLRSRESAYGFYEKLGYDGVGPIEVGEGFVRRTMAKDITGKK